MDDEIKPKVLVCAPVYEGMNYCIDRFLEKMKSLDYSNYDILIIDNSRTNDFFHKLEKEKGIILIKDNTQEQKNKLRLISSRNKILEYAIENGYDYVLMMDPDVIPPKTIINDLLRDNKDIVSGLYYNHFVVNGKQKLSPVCWREIDEEVFEKIKEELKLPSFVKSKEDMRRFLTPEEAESEETLKVMIPSAGCMLIKRNVFEIIKYGLLDEPWIKSTGDDIYFCKKAREAGFEIYCNTKVKCEHLILGKLYKDKEGNLRNPLFD